LLLQITSIFAIGLVESYILIPFITSKISSFTSLHQAHIKIFLVPIFHMLKFILLAAQVFDLIEMKMILMTIFIEVILYVNYELIEVFEFIIRIKLFVYQFIVLIFMNILLISFLLFKISLLIFILLTSH
jgi:hypothetical protein